MLFSKIFDIADVNKDGSLNKEELILSQQILRYVTV